MAEEHPPSPVREDVSLAFRRSRVKPAMTAKGEGVYKENKYYNAYKEYNKTNRFPTPAEIP